MFPRFRERIREEVFAAGPRSPPGRHSSPARRGLVVPNLSAPAEAEGQGRLAQRHCSRPRLGDRPARHLNADRAGGGGSNGKGKVWILLKDHAAGRHPAPHLMTRHTRQTSKGRFPPQQWLWDRGHTPRRAPSSGTRLPARPLQMCQGLVLQSLSQGVSEHEPLRLEKDVPYTDPEFHASSHPLKPPSPSFGFCREGKAGAGHPGISKQGGRGPCHSLSGLRPRSLSYKVF